MEFFDKKAAKRAVCTAKQPNKNAVSRCGPSREKVNRKNPQIFPIYKRKNFNSAEDIQSEAEDIKIIYRASRLALYSSMET